MERAVANAAHYLNNGMVQHVQNTGSFHTSSLKCIAEHLSIYREICLRHKHLFGDISAGQRGIINFVYSVEFIYFSLRNKDSIRLWGSILSDAAFFDPDIKYSTYRVISSLDVKYQIDIESSYCRKLDAIDVFSRCGVKGLELDVLKTETRSPFNHHEFDAEDINTTYVYHLTHFVFYMSNWGKDSSVFNRVLYRNLEVFLEWSMAIGDADLVSECVVAAIYSSAELELQDAIEFLLSRQNSSGSVFRSSKDAENNNQCYDYCRHTTLVYIWALSEYAKRENISFSPSIPQAPNLIGCLEYSEHDLSRIAELESLMSFYGSSGSTGLNSAESKLLLEISKSIRGYLPFLCNRHHLAQLKAYCSSDAQEVGIVDYLQRQLLDAANGELCGECKQKLLINLGILCDISYMKEFYGASGKLASLIHDYVCLPIFQST